MGHIVNWYKITMVLLGLATFAFLVMLAVMWFDVQQGVY